ncbi:MAG: hypothetical protein WAP47_19950 [Candidatus Rokuibacteriota bacterium]
MKPIVSVVLGLMLLGQNTLGWAASDSDESTLEQVGYGTGSVVGSAVYFPFKASFCILGGVSSGFALVFGGPESANKVASAACRGTWAITPDIVKGKERVRFVGEPPARGTVPAAPAQEPRPRN